MGREQLDPFVVLREEGRKDSYSGMGVRQKHRHRFPPGFCRLHVGRRSNAIFLSHSLLTVFPFRTPSRTGRSEQETAAEQRHGKYHSFLNASSPLRRSLLL